LFSYNQNPLNLGRRGGYIIIAYFLPRYLNYTTILKGRKE